MNSPSPGAQAIAALEIEDVFVVSSRTDISRDFNQSDRNHSYLQAMQRHRIEDKVFFQMRLPNNDPQKPFTILRYFATAEVHVAKPGSKFTATNVQDDVPEEERLASIEFVFALDYKCDDVKALTPEMLGAFSKNVAFHMWPYWREAVHAECARLRIPPVTIPMMKQRQSLPAAEKAVSKSLRKPNLSKAKQAR